LRAINEGDELLLLLLGEIILFVGVVSVGPVVAVAVLGLEFRLDAVFVNVLLLEGDEEK